MRAVLIVASISLATAGVFAGVDQAQPQPQNYDAFKKAVEELQRVPNPKNAKPNDWTMVEKVMREALRTDASDSGKRVGANRMMAGLTGGVGYFPHFYLGMALSHLDNRCAEALDEFDESERWRKIVEQKDLYAMLNDRSADCERRGFLRWQEWVAEKANVASALKDANEEARKLRQLTDENASVWINTPFHERQKTAQNDLDQVEAESEKGLSRRLKKDFDDWKSRIGRAKTRIEGIRTDFQTYVRNRSLRGPEPAPVPPSVGNKPPVPAISDELQKDVETKFKNAESRLKRIKNESRVRPPLPEMVAAFNKELAADGKVLADGRHELEEATRLSDVERFKTTGEVPGSLADSFKNLESWLGPPPELNLPTELKTGADQFFKGEYELAIDTLTDEIATSTGATLRAHFYAIRAATLLALYDKGGQTDETLKTRATDDVKFCKKLEPNFAVPLTAFSPRFKAFFDSITQ